ncbi:hypothetical protein [Micromonospora sp. RTP1Z1]|uniref:hypothetical protein n=1 Tax=Micromonospora sp. RTP1Z1 TaxID=2994043 RepID=UPI0029C961CF|nr:hypothetical protein [Micromonospora sp. RTP1Z1]
MAWHRDYADLGLVVIGTHAPEFEFGKRAEKIDRGIRDHGLTYPIALDNDFTFWRTLGNNAWPAKYLFDGEGRLVGRWVGEGGYERVESEIRRLLVREAAVRVLLDGKPIGDERGADVGQDAVEHLNRAARIRLVAGASRDDRLPTLVASQPAYAFAFTFGPRKARP